jgi:hypothetical protein
MTQRGYSSPFLGEIALCAVFIYDEDHVKISRSIKGLDA